MLTYSMRIQKDYVNPDSGFSRYDNYRRESSFQFQAELYELEQPAISVAGDLVKSVIGFFAYLVLPEVVFF